MVSSQQRENILKSWSGTKTEFIPYTSHATAIKHMLDSTVLLLIIPDHQTNKSIITGKLFEYLASGKPVICLGPVDGDAARILRKRAWESVLIIYDSKGISKYLKVLISNPEISEKISPSIYSRENLVKRVVTLLS